MLVGLGMCYESQRGLFSISSASSKTSILMWRVLKWRCLSYWGLLKWRCLSYWGF